MSNLHCPNCDHLIGSLKPAVIPAQRDKRDVSTWKIAVGWEGWQTSGELFQKYSEWAAGRGLAVPTQRTFSSVLVDAGATYKRSNKGRVYARS